MAAEKKPCPKCGEGVFPSDRECMSCGASLATARPAPAPPPPPPVVPQAVAPTGGAFEAVIPVRNGSALTAYYLGLFSLLPFLGLPLGIIAVVLGVKGLQFAKANPGVHGTVHGWVGIICGGFWALAYGAMTMLIIYGALTAK